MQTLFKAMKLKKKLLFCFFKKSMVKEIALLLFIQVLILGWPEISFKVQIQVSEIVGVIRNPDKTLLNNYCMYNTPTSSVNSTFRI